MVDRLIAATALVVASMIVTTGANATLISGTFSGTVIKGNFVEPGFPVGLDINGTPASGSFSISTIAGAVPGGSPGLYILPSGQISYFFLFPALHQTFDFDYGSPNSGYSSALVLSDNGVTQQVSLDALFNDAKAFNGLVLTGPEGSLFNSINDLASLHTGPGVSVASPIFFFNYGQGAANIAVTGSAIQSVPEPSSWVALMTGLMALAGLSGVFGKLRAKTASRHGTAMELPIRT